MWKRFPTYLQTLEEVLMASVDAPQAIGQIFVIDPIEPNLEIFVAGDLAIPLALNNQSVNLQPPFRGGSFGQRQLSPCREASTTPIVVHSSHLHEMKALVALIEALQSQAEQTRYASLPVRR
jgi:hypothetical protein